METQQVRRRRKFFVVWLPGMAHAIVKEHWDWAYRTVWFFGVITVARLVVLWPRQREPHRAGFALHRLHGDDGA